MEKRNTGIALYIPSVNKKATTDGITLIALVVTIIVLLILAGVTISLVVGNNGVITRARETQEATRGDL